MNPQLPGAVPFLILLSALIAAALAVLAEQSTPAPVAADADNDVFSSARARERLHSLLGDESPHPVGSQANALVRQRLTASLESLGLMVETSHTVGCAPRWAVCGRVSNVLAEIPGERRSGLLLMAHYDSVPAAPGAGDNAAAVAALLEVARVLQAEGPFRNSLLFAFTDGEEPALLGAHALFDAHPWKDRIQAVINLEGSGSSGPVNLLRTGPESGHLLRTFRKVAPHPVANSLVEELFKLLPNNTDFNLAIAGGYPGFDFAFAGDRHHYHTPLDSIENLAPGTLQHHGDNVLPLSRALADADLTVRTDNFVYATMQNRAWVSWPLSASMPLAVMAVLLLGAAILLVRREAGWLRILGGAGAAVVVILAVVVVEMAALAAVDAVAGTRVNWPANPWPWRLIIYGAAAFSLLGAGAMLASRLGFWAAHTGGWLTWTLIACVPAALAPLAANVLLVPALFSAAVTLAMALPPVRRREILCFGGTGLCIAFAGYWMLSMTYASEVTTGFSDAQAMYAPLALLAAISMPLLHGGTILRASTAAAAACVMAGVAAPWVTPLYSPERPQHLNIRYVTDADAEDAVWLIDSPNPVPERMQAFGEFVPRKDPEHGNRMVPAMPAPYVAVQAPELVAVNDVIIDGVRHLSLKLRSPRLAPILTLAIPQDTSIIEASAFEQALELSAGGTFAFHDPPPGGVRLELAVTAGDGLNIELRDSSYGLPDEGEALLRARGERGTPVQRGDIWTVRRRIEL